MNVYVTEERDIFWGEALKMGLVQRCSFSRQAGAGQDLRIPCLAEALKP